MALPPCSCGPAKIAQRGTYLWNGQEICDRCKRPLALADRGRVTPSRTVETSVPVPTERGFGRERVTTLSGLPGFVIERSLGIVTSVSSNAGWTAATKGANALDEAMSRLISQASAMGGNAIVGLQASAFGAHGGITNALGGDAVGVMLLGTAVTVRHINADPTELRSGA